MNVEIRSGNEVIFRYRGAPPEEGELVVMRDPATGRKGDVRYEVESRELLVVPSREDSKWIVSVSEVPSDLANNSSEKKP